MTMLGLAYVAVGGAFGSMCRYALVTGISRYVAPNFPYGTFAANVLGSFLLGMLIAVIATMAPPRARDLHLLLAVGFLGGFTTFSTFTMDAYMLMEKGLVLESILYVFGSFVVSLLSFIAGMYIIRLVAY
jgi:fluoride exporter